MENKWNIRVVNATCCAVAVLYNLHKYLHRLSGS